MDQVVYAWTGPNGRSENACPGCRCDALRIVPFETRPTYRVAEVASSALAAATSTGPE